MSTTSKHIANAIGRAASLTLTLLLALGCTDRGPELSESKPDDVSSGDAGHGVDAASSGDDGSTANDASPREGGSTANDARTDENVSRAVPGLYTWTFGGIESLGAADAVALLRAAGYAGIVVDTSREGLLRSYLGATENTGDFGVVAAYVAVQLSRGEQFSDERHKAAIDALAQAGRGDLWLTFRDDNGTQTKEAIRNLVRGVVDYAGAKGVRVVWYPHNNNVYPTTGDAMTLVNEISAPNFGVALNLIHELRAGKGRPDSLTRTFAAAGNKLFAVTLAGAAEDFSTIKALHESNYDLAPFIELIKDSGFSGPVGFLNHTLSNPQTYLPLSLEYWRGQW